MLRSQNIEEEAVEGPTINVMASPLPADVAEVQTLDQTTRGHIRLYRPDIYRLQAYLGEGKGEDLRPRLDALTAVSLVPKDHPGSRGLEVPVNVAESHRTNRDVIPTRCENPEQMDIPLGHNLEGDRRHMLDSVSEVQPLVVFLFAQPFGDKLDALGRINRQEFHSSGIPL